jgi:glutaredoxin
LVSPLVGEIVRQRLIAREVEVLKWFPNRLFGRAPLQRSTQAQARLDRRLAKMTLYDSWLCPYCVTVRRALRRLNIDISKRNVNEPPYGHELLKGGGRCQVPCLRIEQEDGSVEWMYESTDIVRYLEELSGSYS